MICLDGLSLPEELGLYRTIVERGLATSLECSLYDLFEYSLFFIEFQPSNGVESQDIVSLINQEIESIVQQGLTAQEITRAIKKTEMDMLTLKENNQKLAYLIGKYYLAMGDEEYLTRYNSVNIQDIPDQLHALTSTYLRSSVMHQGLFCLYLSMNLHIGRLSKSNLIKKIRLYLVALLEMHKSKVDYML